MPAATRAVGQARESAVIPPDALAQCRKMLGSVINESISTCPQKLDHQASDVVVARYEPR
jgi:hypothetical protein